MEKIKRVIADKPEGLWSVGPDDTVFSAIELMAQKHIGAVLVMQGKKLVGILSERDYAREIILKGRASRETPVKAIMSKNVVTVGPDCQVQEGLSIMTERRIRHLPVVENGKVTGIVSIGDLVKEIIDEQQSTIEQLENYIRG